MDVISDVRKLPASHRGGKHEDGVPLAKIPEYVSVWNTH
jgi:hypothetical protein